MGRRTIFRCDRCGKEFTYDSTHSYIGEIEFHDYTPCCSVSTHKESGRRCVDLCDECTELFRKFLDNQ